VILILYEIIQITSGNRYEARLNNIDRTTLIGLGLLTLVGVFALKDQTDFQAVSFTLVSAVSFIFAYEAIYKWSFYRAPFDPNHPMPPPEVREFVIQAGIAATVLTGFAEGLFTLKKWTYFWLALFVVLWIIWQMAGFPQLAGETFFPKLIPVDFTQAMTYVLSRSTKAVLLFAYLTLFPPLLRK
jgi:hypothetical protein